ncbi:MAG: carboxypeptidase-like regulatory domain-containing protein [Gemmatimonadota bacterium]
MQLVSRFGGQVRRALPTSILVAGALFANACSSDSTGAGPIIPGQPTPNPQITKAAFLADVNLRTHTIKITAPKLDTTGSLRASSIQASPGSVDFSLVGGDVVTLTTSNFAASAIGAFQPGKVRVTFDVNMTNKLSGVQMVGPTVFPAPPPGTTGPLLFPYNIAVAVTSGGTATGGQGNDVIVTLPSYGLVAPSTDWNGAPFNFFNDVGCTGTANDCFRYEEFTGPIFPGSTTGANSVGFDLDPTVGQFTATLIVAADLQNSGPAPTGTVAGTVTSPQLGTLNGVVVTATAGVTNLPGTTAGAGAYSIASVPTGPASVAITSGLPAGCTNPGSQATTVTNGGTATVNFTVICPVPSGTVGGTISFTGFTPSGITGISVVVTPTGGSAQAAVNPSGAGVYSRSGVPVGTGAGAVALGNLPSGCTNPGTGSYSGLTNGGAATVNFSVACVAPPAGYNYNVAFGAPAGGVARLTINLDMSTFNDPAVNGAGPDDISVLQGSFTYNTARLTLVAGSCTKASATQGLDSPTFNVSTPGTIGYGIFTTGTTLLTGLQPVIQCDFTVIGSAIPGAKTATTLLVASSANFDDLLAHVFINEGTLP